MVTLRVFWIGEGHLPGTDPRTRLIVTDCFSDEAAFHVCGTLSKQILMVLLNMSMIHQRPVCGVLWWKTKLLVPSCLKTVWWRHFSGHDGQHCFVSSFCGKSFPIRWCTTSVLLLYSCLSGQGVYWLLDVEDWRFDSSEFFSVGGLLKALLWKSANVNQMHDRNIRAAECITNEMLAST